MRTFDDAAFNLTLRDSRAEEVRKVRVAVSLNTDSEGVSQWLHREAVLGVPEVDPMLAETLTEELEQ